MSPMSNEPRLATAVLVTTGDAENLRILLVERSATLRFFWRLLGVSGRCL